MASDSRTNAGHDQVNVARKMHLFEQPGERVFVLLSSGSLSCTQSIVTQLRRDFDLGKALAQAPSLYDAARIIGEEVRRVSELDRAADWVLVCASGYRSNMAASVLERAGFTRLTNAAGGMDAYYQSGQPVEVGTGTS